MDTSVIIAHMGYAESGYASSLIFLNEEEEFPSGLDAVSSLAKSFLFKYLEEGNLLHGTEFSIESFEGFIVNHVRSHMDEYGSSLIEFGFWDEFMSYRSIFRKEIPPSEIIELDPYAEQILIRALTGTELDDSIFHHWADSYKESLSKWEFWYNGRVHTRDSLNEIIEEQRL